MKVGTLLVWLIVGPILCLVQDKPGQDEKRIWGRSYSVHPLPDGKDTRLQVLGINQDLEHLFGVFVLIRQRKGTMPQLVIQGHLDKGGQFSGNVSLEVSDREDGNWKTVESSFSDKVDVTLTGAPHIDKLFIRVQLNACQPYLGKFRFCRVVLQTGESSVFPMVWLTEEGKEIEH